MFGCTIITEMEFSPMTSNFQNLTKTTYLHFNRPVSVLVVSDPYFKIDFSIT